MASVTGYEFERIEIGGNARVHQGDSHNGNSFHISSVNTLQVFTTTDERLPLHSATKITRFRSDSDLNTRYDCSTKRQSVEHATRVDSKDSNHKNRFHISSVPPPAINHRYGYGEKPRTNAGMKQQRQRSHSLGEQDQGVYQVREKFLAPCFDEERKGLSLCPKVSRDIPECPDLGQSQSILDRTDEKHRHYFDGLIDRLCLNQYFPTVVNILRRPSQHDIYGLIKAAWSAMGHEIRSANPGIKVITQDMLATCLAIFAFLELNAPLSQSNNVVTTKPQIRKSPWLTALVVCAVARYICFPVVIRSISELMVDGIILEDPFGIEWRIPMSHCEHFKMLEAILSVRLAGTTAEAFVEAGQFNLTLGKRDGQPIKKSDWSTKGRIKPRHRVVMAVYLKKSDARCTECQSQLTMSAVGHFACHPCGRFYGNCAALKLWVERNAQRVVRSSTAQKLPQARGRVGAVAQAPTVQEANEDNEDNFDINGLKHIDLRILRSRKEYRCSLTTDSNQQVTAVSLEVDQEQQIRLPDYPPRDRITGDDPHRPGSQFDLATSLRPDGLVQETVSTVEKMVVRQTLVGNNASGLTWQHEMSVSYQANRTMHVLTHRDADFECLGCTNCFTTYGGMIIHIESGTCPSGLDLYDLNESAALCFQWSKYIDPDLRNELLEGEYPSEEPYKCPTCSRWFGKLSGLFQHVESPSCSQTLYDGAIEKLKRWLWNRHT